MLVSPPKIKEYRNKILIYVLITIILVSINNDIIVTDFLNWEKQYNSAQDVIKCNNNRS